MLVYGIKLSILLVASIGGASLALRKLFFQGVGRKVVILWVLVLPFIFWIRNEQLSIFAFFALLILINKDNPPIITIVFFIATLGASPVWLHHAFSAPGINYLLTLSFDRVAVIALLLPLFFQLSKSSRLKFNLTDVLVCAFVICTTILTFREGKITNVMRHLIDSSLIYIVPYFVISRFVRTIKDLHYCSLGILLLSVMLCAVLVISQLVQIDIYEAVNPRSRYNVIREYRGGFLRLAGPLTGVMTGYILFMAYLSLDILKRYKLVAGFLYWPLVVVFIFCVLFGGSRGALFGVIMGVTIYYYLIKLSSTQRIIAAVLFFVFIMLELVFNLSSFLAYNDEYGTFDYRSELYSTAFEFLKYHPFFGMQNYIDTGFFDHLVTGLGIIDIVSAYVGVALQYGYVGLLLFISMFLSVIIPLFQCLMKCKDTDSDYAKYIAMYFASTVTIMFVISTTSLISVFPIFVMINLAVGRALIVRSNFI